MELCKKAGRRCVRMSWSRRAALARASAAGLRIRTSSLRVTWRRFQEPNAALELRAEIFRRNSSATNGTSCISHSAEFRIANVSRLLQSGSSDYGSGARSTKTGTISLRWLGARFHKDQLIKSFLSKIAAPRKYSNRKRRKRGDWKHDWDETRTKREIQWEIDRNHVVPWQRDDIGAWSEKKKIIGMS